AFAIAALAAPTPFKRQVVSHQGSGQVSGQSTGVSNGNVNNGVQVDSSLVNGGGSLPNAVLPEDFNPFLLATPPNTNPGSPVNPFFGGAF
ncbi:hypothetical protein LPJ56_006080, partial [Coemansia sp. RSA 2599]